MNYKSISIFLGVLLTCSASVNAETTLPDNWRSVLPPRDEREVELALAIEQVKLGTLTTVILLKLPPASQRELNLLITLAKINKDVSIDSIWSEIKMRRLFDELEDTVRAN